MRLVATVDQTARPIGRASRCACAVLLLASSVAMASPRTKADPKPAASAAPHASAEVDDPLAKYFAALEQMKLVDVESGNLETLRRELGIAEGLLKDGAFANAAVTLYAIVKSPRYSAFTEFVEFQNAEYDLAVALARAGSYGAALRVLSVDQVDQYPPHSGPCCDSCESDDRLAPARWRSRVALV